jgi:hypothetical protein
VLLIAKCNFCDKTDDNVKIFTRKVRILPLISANFYSISLPTRCLLPASHSN